MRTPKLEQEMVNGDKGKCKGTNGNKDKRRTGKRKLPKRIAKNNQVEKFKMAEGKTWESTFQGKCHNKQVKWMGTFICPRYHTKGECWDKGCKYSKMHVPVSVVPQNEKKEYLDYMGCWRKKSSVSELGVRPGPSSVRPQPIQKAHDSLERILLQIAVISTSTEASNKFLINPNKSKQRNIPGMERRDTIIAADKTVQQEVLQGTGTKHAMILLGELHKNESFSTMWDWERAPKSNASSEAISPIIQERAVPSCPKPRIWISLEENIEDPPTKHCHDNIPTRASPGEASNG